MRYLSAVILLITLCTSCYVSEELPADQKAWEYDFPSNVGLNNSALYTLDNQIDSRNYAEINGLIIIKDDKLVFENYYNGHTRTSIHPIGRATTGVAALVLGLMIEQGLIANLDIPISNYLPEYQNIFDTNPSKKNITFRHLLSNQMGVSWNEYTVNTERVESDFYQMKLQSDWAAYVLSQNQEAPPGLRLVLNSGSSMLLSKIFESILIDITLEEFIDQEVFKPLNIVNYEWSYDPSGTLDLCTGLSISTLDFTRLGYLMLNEGRWTDKRRVINRDWILDCTIAQTPFLEDLDFGYFWWVFSDQFNSIYTNNNKAYWITGYRGESIYVVPEEKMVITVMANNPYSNIVYNQSMNVYLKIIDALNFSEQDS